MLRRHVPKLGNDDLTCVGNKWLLTGRVVREHHPEIARFTWWHPLFPQDYTCLAPGQQVPAFRKVNDG